MRCHCRQVDPVRKFQSVAHCSPRVCAQRPVGGKSPRLTSSPSKTATPHPRYMSVPSSLRASMLFPALGSPVNHTGYPIG